jgi:Mn-dependent DtxR family transcriptional regulator
MSGIEWKYIDSISPYTECPHCHNINCQESEPEQEDREETEEENDG